MQEGRETIWNDLRGEAKGFGMRSAFALRIDSGIIFFICISAKPAGLAEMLFSQEGS